MGRGVGANFPTSKARYALAIVLLPTQLSRAAPAAIMGIGEVATPFVSVQGWLCGLSRWRQRALALIRIETAGSGACLGLNGVEPRSAMIRFHAALTVWKWTAPSSAWSVAGDCGLILPYGAAMGAVASHLRIENGTDGQGGERHSKHAHI